MSDNDLLTVSIAGFVIAILGWIAARYTVWRHKRALARQAHPAE